MTVRNKLHKNDIKTVKTEILTRNIATLPNTSVRIVSGSNDNLVRLEAVREYGCEKADCCVLGCLHLERHPRSEAQWHVNHLVC